MAELQQQQQLVACCFLRAAVVSPEHSKLQLSWPRGSSVCFKVSFSGGSLLLAWPVWVGSGGASSADCAGTSWAEQTAGVSHDR